jgi:hypothetical protein
MINRFNYAVFLCLSLLVVPGDSENSLLKDNDSTQKENVIDTTKHKGYLTGGRSRASIMHVVMENIHELRYAYNVRLRDRGHPYFSGKIWIKFAIDEFGKVIYCEAIKDSTGDGALVSQSVQIVKSWKFDNIHKPGDVTEVVYPFVFTASDNSNNSTTNEPSKFKIRYVLIPVIFLSVVMTGILAWATIAVQRQ